MKTIFILLALYLAYVVLKGLFFRSGFRVRRPASGVDAGAASTGAPPPDDTAEATVEDPVCGSFVPVSVAVAAETPEGTVYFCSTACRDRYLSGR